MVCEGEKEGRAEKKTVRGGMGCACVCVCMGVNAVVIEEKKSKEGKKRGVERERCNEHTGTLQTF